MFQVRVSNPDTIREDMHTVLLKKLYIGRKYQMYLAITHVVFNSKLFTKRSLCRAYRFTVNKEKHKRPMHICALAYDLTSGEPVGCLYIYGCLSQVYVKPKFRRKGIATKLYEETSKHYDLSHNVKNLGTTKAALKMINKIGLTQSFSSRPIPTKLQLPTKD